jgi:hypothetical protein
VDFCRDRRSKLPQKNNQAKTLRQRLHIMSPRDASCGTAVGSQAMSLQRFDKNNGGKNRQHITY